VQTDCEKTEYALTDTFNSYGVYFIILLALDYSDFNGNLNKILGFESLNYLADNKVFFYPKVFSKEFNSGVILDVLRSICAIENRSVHCQKEHLNVFYSNLIENYLNTVMSFNQDEENKFLDFKKPKSSIIPESVNKEKIEFVNKDYSKYFSKFILEYLNVKAEEKNEKLLMSLSNLYEVFSNLLFFL